jgi:DNA (cytosine-5)-methyltransferase 1
MSSTSSAELAASASGSNEPECEPSPSARSIHLPVASSPSIGRTSPGRDRLWIVAYPSRPERRPLSSPRQRLAWADGLSQWQESPSGFGPGCEAMADATGEHGDGRGRGSEPARRHEFADGGSLSHAEDNASISTGIGRHKPSWSWRVEPDVGRVAHGVSDRTHRLKGLGNAVVPQIPEIIGRAIMTALALSSPHL